MIFPTAALGRALEAWWRAGADNFAWHRSDTPETMWASALEVIGVSRPEDAPFLVHRDLEPTGQDDPSLLAFMDERHLARV
jgi:hypothetical protein